MCSCGNQSETPIQLAERMKALACAGDVEGFYGYVDKLSVENNLKNISTQKIREDIADPDAILEFEEIVIPSLVVLKWEIMNRELKSGQGGAFCNMQTQNDPGNENSINIVFPNGETSTWGFEKKAGQLILVSILDEEPFDFAGLDIGLKTASELENNSNIVIKNKQANKVVISDKESTEQIEEPSKIVNQTRDSSANNSRGWHDFGTARWGMTIAQVISSEASTPISESANSLKYIGTYNGMDAEVVYVFSGDRLVRGRYKSRSPHSDEIAYLRDYMRMKELLTGKFGKPQINEEQWTNSLYKDNPERHGFAVYIGHLSYRAKWTTNRSNILLELKSNNYNMLLEALYSGR